MPILLTGLWMRPRLVAAIALAAALLVILPWSWGWSTRVLVAWCLSVLLYIVLIAVVSARKDPAAFQAIASKLDDSAVGVLVLCLLATVASFVAVVAELSGVKTLPAGARSGHLALTMATLVFSWAFIQTEFSVHYTHMYYGDDDPTDDIPYRGGLDFGGDDEPDFWDFMYFTATVGATFQTSDTDVTTRVMRRTVLAQSVFSFFFNTTILALAINIAAGLLS